MINKAAGHSMEHSLRMEIALTQELKALQIWANGLQKLRKNQVIKDVLVGISISEDMIKQDLKR
jgi:hypothetical protein